MTNGDHRRCTTYSKNHLIRSLIISILLLFVLEPFFSYAARRKKGPVAKILDDTTIQGKDGTIMHKFRIKAKSGKFKTVYLDETQLSTEQMQTVRWRKKRKLKLPMFEEGNINAALQRDTDLNNVNFSLLSQWGEAFIHNISTLIQEHSIVRKNSVSDRTRLFMLVGLEGTGHHAWEAMFDVCFSKGLCQADHELNSIVFNALGQSVLGLFGVTDHHIILHHCKRALDRMTALVQSGNQTLYVLGMERTEFVGQLSYPSFSGPYKPLDRPDIHLLAILAELAGLDFRVLVLQRTPKDIIFSTMRRKYSSPKILNDNAAALYQQVSMIDPAFYACAEFDYVASNMSDTDQQRLLDFIYPVQLKNMQREMFARFQAPHRLDREAGTIGLTAVTMEMFEQQLGVRLRGLQRLCSEQAQ